VELTGSHTLELSACKGAEADDKLILRFWNVARQPTEAGVLPAYPPTEVRLVDLKEDPLGADPLPLEADGSFLLHAEPAQVVTVALSFPSPGSVDGHHAARH
jgi:mannosylglycerate hydrolase